MQIHIPNYEAKTRRLRHEILAARADTARQPYEFLGRRDRRDILRDPGAVGATATGASPPTVSSPTSEGIDSLLAKWSRPLGR